MFLSVSSNLISKVFDNSKPFTFKTGAKTKHAVKEIVTKNFIF